MVVVRFVLSQFKNESLQRAAIFSYLFIYVFPVGYVVFSKLWVSASIDSVEEGTFCFKPSMSVRINQVPFLYFDKYNTVYTRYVVFFSSGQSVCVVWLRVRVDSALAVCTSPGYRHWKRRHQAV